MESTYFVLRTSLVNTSHFNLYVVVHDRHQYRTVNGMFSADAIEGSMRDLDIALTITRKSEISTSNRIDI